MKRLPRIFAGLFIVLGLIFTSGAFAGLTCQPLIHAEPHQVVPPRHATGILWQITGPGLKPSYLMGTVHISDERVVDLPPHITKRFDNADSLTLEVNFEEGAEQEFVRAMFYRNGSRLDNEIGQDLYRMAMPLLAKHGVNPETAANLKPWAALLILSMPPPSHNKLPLDVVLMQRAQSREIEVHGLETIQEQLSVFDTIERQDQIDLLRDTVCHYQTIQSDISEAIEFYLKRDLGGLASLGEKYAFYKDERYQKFMDSFLVERNKKMTDNMQVRLQEGNAFIAVGSLHLPGEKGIIGLLERRGYQLTPVY